MAPALLARTSPPARTGSPVSRRGLFLAGALGLAATAAFGPLAPASAADGDQDWSEEFFTARDARASCWTPWTTGRSTTRKFIIAAVKGHDLGETVGVIALSTAIVESWLYNYQPAVDADSGGLFQQRPSMGWGSEDEVRHKKHALDAFLGLGEHSQAPGLLQVAADVESWEPGAAAQAVQASAHPERYVEQVAAARTLWDRYAADLAPYRG